MNLILTILRDQSLQAVTIAALILGLVDWGYAIVKAAADRTFTLRLVAEYLTAHVLLRAVPIVFLGFLGASLTAVTAGIPSLDPALVAIITGATLGAWGGLVAYAGETYRSLQDTRKGDDL